MWISNGYAQERIKDPHTGRIRTVSIKVRGKTEKAKQEAFKRLAEKIDYIFGDHLLLSQAIDLYLKELSATLKASSVTNYTRVLGNFLEVVGDMRLENMSAGYIRTKLLESGKPHRTLNGYIHHFKMFLKWAYRNDYIKTNEVNDKLTLFQDTPKRDRIQDKYLEPRELKKLLDEMELKHWKLLSEFLVLSGLRIGEAIALDRADIKHDVILVRKTYDYINKKMSTPKTISSTREVYIQDELKDCIVRINEYCKWQAEVFGYSSTIFFPGPDGGRLSYIAYHKYLAELSEAVLRRPVSPHIFRHTHCSILASKGMSLEAISSRLGHGDSEITKKIYFHKLEESKERERKQLNKISLIS